MSEQPAPAAATPSWPDGVSVVMPVLNEERHLSEAVTGILGQDWAGPLEIVLALGPSTDRTDEVARRLHALDERVVLVPNPSGRTPSGLNAAIRASRYEVVVRVDGHALLPRDYVTTAVGTLRRTGADNVGGVMAAEGQTDYERAVARAMTTSLGVGAAPFHVGGGEGPAETVYLGCFRKAALERVGGYDETFLRAQDWEMNHRLRATGGTVWFDPRLVVTYRPRPSASALASQYFHYGRWRREVMRRHPETVSRASALRYFAPPAAVVGVAAGTAAGVVASLGGPRTLRWGWLAPAGYAALVGLGGAWFGRGLPPAAHVELPAVYATMHAAWGLGFLSSPPDLRPPHVEH
ncbi:MAG: glycosyltransferase family 2 protein [Candidatus Nanopelagicales bacterium]|jgi:glycosyltransferase involved in cell wall biosynthesis|nr:glycosyltransferase family 2 protein [Candidatus Nanopelagicales bacterium]